MCIKNLTIVFFLFFGLNSNLFAWENIETHPALTQRAIESSTCVLDNYLSELGISGGINTDLEWDFPESIKERMEEAEPDNTTRSVLEWIKAGSIIEDERKIDLRYSNHFHDPYRNAGLDNTENANLLRYYFYQGDSARNWAINHGSNEFDWQSARNHFYYALTKQTESEREEYLASTFLRLGHVLHVLEDMGVPAHARNDSLFAHVRHEFFDQFEPLERWVEMMIPSDGSLDRWISGGWTPTPQVFSNVSDYFDADIYTGNYLGDGVPTPGTWGLSERTNYQFLSWTTIFEEDFLNSLYYFPQPARIHTEDVNESGRIYLAGYGVDHLARKTMSQHHLQHNHLNRAWCILGEAIYDDYAEITIPRTIDYATGLANYFFRGRLESEITDWNSVNHNIEITIKNKSINSDVEQTLKGGTFELYWDDKDSNRTPITAFVIAGGWTSSSALVYDANITITFTKPAGAEPVKYITVYKGNICQNPALPDNDDANAIAVCVLHPGFEIVAWGLDTYNQVSDVPQGSDFIAVAAGKRHGLALKSDGSILAWGSNAFGQCNTPTDGNDFFTAVAAGARHSIALKSDGTIAVWGDDSLNQITSKPTGNDFVAIAAGEYHSLALRPDGSIVGWGGWNYYGECDTPAPDPFTIYIAISAGKYHSIALQSDYIPKAWGDDYYGQTTFYSGVSGVAVVAACDNYSLLLRDDDWLVSWGGGDWLNPNVPRYHYRHSDVADFVKIAAGWDHILALTIEGEILSWDWPMGDYSFDFFSRDVPAGIVFTDGSTGSPQASIAAGYDFSLALKAP